jgi:glycine reductase
MQSTIRIVHYLNQFFGQIGGEEHAHIGPFVKEDLTGPGQLLRKLIEDRGEIVASVICGDNYFAEKIEQARQEILDLIIPFKPDLLVAGPAFNAGRYGIACGELCKFVQERLGIATITGMHPENPGADLYKTNIYICETGPNARGMSDAMKAMATLALKLLGGVTIGAPEVEGYIPRGLKVNVRAKNMASERAINALLSKIKGEPFKTEIRKPVLDSVPLAQPIRDVKKAVIGLVTEGGLVPMGNPDHVETHRATKYGKYSIAGLDSLKPGTLETIHVGYDKVYVNNDPNRLVPVDVVREMERAGEIGKLHDYFFSTSGVAMHIEAGKKIGASIARELKSSGVQAVILTST